MQEGKLSEPAKHGIAESIDVLLRPEK